MRDNPEVFKDSDMNFIYDRIHAVVQNKLISWLMLATIDPIGTNWTNSDAIELGFKTLDVTLSPLQVFIICKF